MKKVRWANSLRTSDNPQIRTTVQQVRQLAKLGLECEGDADAGYYAGAVEIILTYHGESLRSKFADN